MTLKELFFMQLQLSLIIGGATVAATLISFFIFRMVKKVKSLLVRRKRGEKP